MASPDNNVPLFHELYPGSANGAEIFSEIIYSLKERCSRIHGSADITLVFDCGNNSAASAEKLIEEEPFAFHFVGGSEQNQCP